MANSEGPEMRQGHNKIRNVSDVVIGEVQDSELLHTSDLRRDLGEPLMTEIEFPKVRGCSSHIFALPLQCRTMEGSDVKQRYDVLDKHG